MGLMIQNTRMEQLNEVMDIYSRARDFMKQNGNPNQWGNSWPSRNSIVEDIECNRHFSCFDEHNKRLAVFAFEIGNYPLYDDLDGRWLVESEKYGMIFRIASDVHYSKGAASFCLNWAYEKCKDVRIDTRPENTPMIACLEKNGFVKCGKIKQSVRIAFQKV